MDRRNFMKLGVAGTLSVSTAGRAVTRNPARLDVTEKDARWLQAEMSAGRLTSVALTKAYLTRIRALDQRGPRLNAVIEINPEALAIATRLDKERLDGHTRGPLHGIPVLIKDNIATADRMQTTAGSLALVGAKAPRDAFLVARLRDAGAIILGKTNLSEWANIRSTRATSGWSARGGLTRNPYALDRNTSGSSSGSAAAAAASLATLTVGTETDGSITSPAAICGLVGVKPTVGLVSRDGIVPIAHSQDTAGPMTRTVSDAALLLDAMRGRDTRDAATANSPDRTDTFASALTAHGLKGARLGVVRNQFGAQPQVHAAIDAALAKISSAGATLIDVELPNTEKYADAELEVLLFELKADLNTYLAEFGAGSHVASLEQVIAFNELHRAREMAHFDQELFVLAQAKGNLDDPSYLSALATCQRYARAEGLDPLFADHQLDALLAPTCGPAWLTDFINGDHYGASFTSPAAVAGYPHITVPAGQVAGLPVGLSFVGRAWSEASLFRLAYSFEHHHQGRQPPNYPASAKLR